MFDAAPPSGSDPLLATQAEELTRQFVAHFYRQDSDWCLPYCDPNIVYMGTSQLGLAFGLDQFRAIMTNDLATFEPSLVLDIVTRATVLPDGRTAVVIARFYHLSDPSSRYVMANRKRSTFIWHMTDEGLRLLHLHYSVTISNEDTAGDNHDVSYETYVYAQTLIDQVIRRNPIILRDIEGATHNLSAPEVRYIEARRQQTVVHSLSGDIVVRRGFSNVVKLFGDELEVVHRSFAVNPQCVRTMRGDAVILDNGVRIPLPQRHSKEVRRHLEKAIKKTSQGPYPFDISPYLHEP